MLLDPNFDYRTDANGKDPDKHSPTMRLHHQILWSKPLPSGKVLNLEIDPGGYLAHRSELGEQLLSSDTISNSLRHQKRMAHIISQVSSEELDAFQALGASVGAITLFPGNKVEGGLTINVARGFNSRIGDRIDLTLECIRRHYLGESSPLGETLQTYSSFFGLFKDFVGYSEFFLFQDLVEGKSVKFFLPFDGSFAGSANPKDLYQYREYMENTMSFVSARRDRAKAVMQDHLGN